VSNRKSQRAREAKCKEFLALQSTVQLGQMYDELARQHERDIDCIERRLGMSIVEHALNGIYGGGNSAGVFNLPFAGLYVRDFLPADYDGIERAKRGELLPEVAFNAIPTSVTLSKKVEIAFAQYTAAHNALDASTKTGRVRALISAAVYQMLSQTLMGTFFAMPPRPSDRGVLLDGVFEMIKTKEYLIAKVKAKDGSEGGLIQW
jgi:hypothetical protein